MKPMTNLQNRFLAYGVAAILLGSMSIATVARAGDDALVRSEGGVSYVSGGVGSESLDQLALIAREFNLKLVFARVSGDYLSDVRVLIADAKGHTLLETTADGPWLLANLPAGNYRIAATLAGKEQQRHVTIDSAKQLTVDFRWTSP